MDSIRLTTILLLLFGAYSTQPVDNFDDFLIFPMDTQGKTQKREATGHKKLDYAEFCNFVEEKLLQHSQALEQVMKSVQNNEDLIKNLLDNLSVRLKKPELPEKIEVHHQTRRSSNDNDNDSSLVRLGKHIPKYGALVKDIIVKQVRDNVEPQLKIEKEKRLESDVTELLTRRSMSGPLSQNSLMENQNSPFCPVAMVCHRTVKPICGYDDNFGYGKFDDVCHMLQVNCYWKYNFSLVPNCRPTL